MNQQIQKRQASALDRAKVALAHGAHAIDSSDVSELIQELEKLMAERKADDVREQRKKSAKRRRRHASSRGRVAPYGNPVCT